MLWRIPNINGGGFRMQSMIYYIILYYIHLSYVSRTLQELSSSYKRTNKSI